MGMRHKSGSKLAQSKFSLATGCVIKVRVVLLSDTNPEVVAKTNLLIFGKISAV